MKDINCILCKNCNNNKNCQEVIFSNNWHCPSLSNIYYDKLVKWFPFNLIEKIKTKISYKQLKKYYKDFNEDHTENSEMKFIWGIKSSCDLSESQANLMTMNDFEILYFKGENRYAISVETLISFDDGYDGEKRYLESILDTFTEWMIQNNYKIESELNLYSNLYSMFTEGYNINTHFKTIEDAYRTFAILVRGY